MIDYKPANQIQSNQIKLHEYPFDLKCAGNFIRYSRHHERQMRNLCRLQSKISMHQTSDRKQSAYTLFAIISTILSLGHFVVLEFSVTIADEVDKQQSVDPKAIPDWNAQMNIPFAVVLGVFATTQFLTSLAIALLNRNSGAGRLIYYCSLLGMLVAFAIGVSLTILSSQYNSAMRLIPKNQTEIPSLDRFYYSIQVDSVATLLITVPMLFFIYYYNLEDYLQEQRETKTTLAGPQNQGNTIWQLSIFLLNSLAHVGFIYNIYQFTAIEDTKDYNLDNVADQYTFYLAVGVAVTLISIILQLRHFQHTFLSKRQLIMLATLTALFQFGAFILMAVKAVQFHLDISLMKDGNCYFPDCDESGTFRWEITAYTSFTLIALIAQIPYFKTISRIQEKDQSRDTLLTEEGQA